MRGTIRGASPAGATHTRSDRDYRQISGPFPFDLKLGHPGFVRNETPERPDELDYHCPAGTIPTRNLVLS